jgi:hypothetical protein
LPYFPENISNTEGVEGCLKKQIDSEFSYKKKLNNSRSFTTGKATISEERKRQ